MAYPTAAGHPQYSGSFIPEIWSGKLIEKFYDPTVLSQISNTDYEGEIKKFGDTVNIRSKPTLTVRDWKKGQVLEVETPEAPKVQLVIDKGDYFAAVEDDLDKIQSDIALMNMWSADAAEQMKIKIDQRVLTDLLPGIASTNKGLTAGVKTSSFNLGTTASPLSVTKDGASGTVSVTDLIVDIGTVLDEANVPVSGRFMVVPAIMANRLAKSELKDASLTGDAQSTLRNGRLGSINNFTLYVSHNLLVEATGKFHIIAGTKQGFTFATQMTELETLRMQTMFGNLIRGLQVYGYKVLRGECLVEAVCQFP